MKEKESHPIRNGIIATVIGGILLTFWPPFRDVIVKILSWVWGLFVGLWNYLSSEHHVYGWVIIFFVLLSIPALVVGIRKLISSREPGYQDLYTEDHLYGAKWHWGYANGSITHLWCLCPQCESELVYSEFVPDQFNIDHVGKPPRTEFICEKCRMPRASLEGRKDYALGTVEREIRRKIRIGEWKENESSS